LLAIRRLNLLMSRPADRVQKWLNGKAAGLAHQERILVAQLLFLSSRAVL
jgi:hypothetical protein